MKRQILFTLVSLVFLTTVCKAQESKWITLFDGSSTDKFRGYNMKSFPDSAWKVEDGALVTQTGVPNIDLVTKEAYKTLNWIWTGKYPKAVTVAYSFT